MQGYSDEHFESARTEVISWTEKNGIPKWAQRDDYPPFANIAHWRNHRRLRKVVMEWAERLNCQDACHALWQSWKKLRLAQGKDLFAPHEEVKRWLKHLQFSGEQDLVVWLYIWARKDRHLKEMEDGVRRRALAHRKDVYRNIAARLASRYGRLEIEDMDLAGVARRKTPDKDQDEACQAARRQRTQACPSQLKECLVLAFKGAGAEVVKKKPEALDEDD
jgi:hypothetical protein